MPSFNPFSAVTGRHAASLFEIRYVSAPPRGLGFYAIIHTYARHDSFIVFRGSEHESAAQITRGVVVLCLPSPLKIEDVRLRLTGTLRLK